MDSRGQDITRTSLGVPLVAASVVLCAALAWAIVDETVTQRPWKAYQSQFRSVYTAHLRDERAAADAARETVRNSPEFRDIERRLGDAERAAAPRLGQIQAALEDVRSRLDALSPPLQDARARMAALVYELDHSSSQAERVRIQRRIHALDEGPLLVGAERLTLPALEERFNALRADEASLASEELSVSGPQTELRRSRDEYVARRADGLTTAGVDAALRRMENFPIEIRQIRVPESGVVDRCESCHLGTREALAWPAGAPGAPRVFAKHPSPPLLAIHDPERFGCTPCHDGNGAATSSVARAHGENSGWPAPLFDGRHREAGCVRCHRQDRVLDYAPAVTRARDLYQVKGCAACHRYEGFDREADALASIRDEIRRLQAEAARDRLDVPREIANGDSADTNDEARQHYARATSLRLAASTIDARIAELTSQAAAVERDRKTAGPTLKDARAKLRKAWVPVWLVDPQAFQPGTNMPRFRLRDDERRAIAAFVWQNADAPSPHVSQPKGDARRGRELYETLGCQGCHDTFAGNLARLGEKADYDYTVAFIHDPAERSTLTVMPSFRLSWPESRDIATYLTGLRNANAEYPPDVSYMDDPALARAGRALVSRYGCANCHEIRGFEGVPRVGTDLTREGSKPIEQLDFGLLATSARREGWYTPTGFFEHKLSDAAVYDRGRTKAQADRLRMPDVALSDVDVRALSTFLSGSVDRSPAFPYEPKGIAKDLQDGWWIVKKYNCTGCHSIQPAQPSTLSTLARYQDPDWKEKLPPGLHQEGARVTPEWLARFLADPSLGAKDPNRNGVRSYLQVRMPSFNLSPNEIRTLVRFFEALAGQEEPYIAPPLTPLTPSERAIARALFSSRKAVCVKCHIVGDVRHDRTATAPDLLLTAGRLKPDWTLRWVLQPQELSPGTAMPANLFRGEQAALVVRYMFELTAAEQQRLLRLLPASPSAPPTADRRP